MATLDIFNDDAFSVSQLTQTITDIPRIPTQLGDEGLGDAGTTGGDDDPVKGGLFRPATRRDL